jgi:hypothetical protein
MPVEPMPEQLATAKAIFGSKTRTLVLDEVAKAVQPVNAFALARVSGLDPKKVYEECAKLNSIGIFDRIATRKNQTGYLYTNSEEAKKLKQFVLSIIKKRSGASIIEKLSASLPITDYYVSLPIALKITFDVFYSPDYVLLFLDRRDKAMIPTLLKYLRSANVDLVQKRPSRIIIKAVSLWGREFKYDKLINAPLASNEQSIADGLNYYREIRDRELIRTLLTRTSDFDLRKVVDKLSEKGKTRFYAIIAIKKKVLGKLDKQEEEVLASFQSRLEGKSFRLDNVFKSDLSIEAIPMLLPNDEAYSGRKESRISKAVATVSEVLNDFA